MKHANTKYSLNDRYFEQIDSEEKAYWLGFLAADGCVYQKKGVSQVTLALKGADAGHVAKFAAAIGTDKPVKLSKSKLKGKTYPRARLAICSKQMTEDLISQGVRPRKSLNAEVWNGPEHLIRHYWRGVVDGDGWVSEIDSSNRGEVHAVGLCGSKNMVRAFRDWICVLLDLHVEPQPKGKIFSVSFGGTFAPQKVARLLYADTTVYLDRKLERASALLAVTFVPSKFAPRTDVTDEQLIAAYAELRSTKKVGKQFKLDAGTVADRLKKNNITLRKSRWE